eukprot:1871218-Alexandrium_andersonii.AAC.1
MIAGSLSLPAWTDGRPCPYRNGASGRTCERSGGTALRANRPDAAADARGGGPARTYAPPPRLLPR